VLTTRYAVQRLVHASIIALVVLCASLPAPTAAFGVERVGDVVVASQPALASTAPDVSIPSGVLRTTDGRTLWERDADAVRPIASITKVMTALVVLDQVDPAETVTVSAQAAAVRESGVDLVAGQRLTVQQLLEAMLVPSANDAAYALAEHVAGGEEAFVRLMNQKAADVGLKQTRFANPHGLDGPGHHSTARDIATLTTIAMSNPRFASIVALPAITMSNGGSAKRFENSNELLGTYAGLEGVKTGWTRGAGYCLAASAHRDDVGLVAVVLGAGSENERFRQTEKLLDWGFSHYAFRQVASAEETAGLVPVTTYLDRTVTAVVQHDAVVPVFDLDGEVTARVDMIAEVTAPVERGQRLGTLTVVQGSRLLAQVPIVAATGIERPDRWESFRIWLTRAWRTAFGGDLQAEAAQVM